MIKIGNTDYIKTSGTFKLDALHVKKYTFEFPTLGSSKQTLLIELVPFAYMDDGSRVYDLETVHKIFIPDVDAYVSAGTLPNVVSAYFATEQGIADILTEKIPNLQATFIPPAA